MRQTYKYMGFLLTLNGWAVRLGIPYDVLRLRLAKGWSVKRAFETPVDKSERASAREARAKRNAPHKKRTKVLEYNGVRRTVSEWARRLDVPKVTIYLPEFATSFFEKCGLSQYSRGPREKNAIILCNYISERLDG